MMIDVHVCFDGVCSATQCSSQCCSPTQLFEQFGKMIRKLDVKPWLNSKTQPNYRKYGVGGDCLGGSGCIGNMCTGNMCAGSMCTGDTRKRCIFEEKGGMAYNSMHRIQYSTRHPMSQPHAVHPTKSLSINTLTSSTHQPHTVRQ